MNTQQNASSQRHKDATTLDVARSVARSMHLEIGRTGSIYRRRGGGYRVTWRTDSRGQIVGSAGAVKLAAMLGGAS